MEPRSSSDDQREFQNWVARSSSLGIQFALFLLLFFFIGYWLDQKLGSSPWFMIAGAILGFTGGTVWLYRQAFPAARESDEPRNDGEGRS